MREGVEKLAGARRDFHPLPLWERVARRAAARRVRGSLSESSSRSHARGERPLIRRFAPPSPTRGEGRSSRAAALEPFVASAQAFQRGEEDDRDRRQDHSRCRDGRADVLADAAEHLARQGALFRTCHEQHDHHLVEAGREGEQRSRCHAGQDERQDHAAERIKRRGAERGGGARQIGVETLQRRADRDHHKGRRQRGMGQDQAEIAAGQSDRREEEIQADRGDDAGHDDRRQHESQHERLEPALPLRQPQRRQRAEHHRQQGRGHSDDHAVLQRIHPARAN